MSTRVDAGIARKVEPSFIVARLEEGENPQKWQRRRGKSGASGSRSPEKSGFAVESVRF
jgi:hypothetical protein